MTPRYLATEVELNDWQRLAMPINAGMTGARFGTRRQRVKKIRRLKPSHVTAESPISRLEFRQGEVLKHATLEHRVDVQTAIAIAADGPKFEFAKANKSEKLTSYLNLSCLPGKTIDRFDTLRN